MQDTKLQRTLFILDEFHKRSDNILHPYDERLIEECGLSVKQMGRLLDEIANELDGIEHIKVGKKKAYKLLKPMDLLVEAFKNTNEISWLFNPTCGTTDI